MENLHLFTSLMILYLAMSINARRPFSFHEKEDDAFTYEAGKDVLRDMIQAGSLAARGHEHMLKEVEDLGRIIARGDGVGLSTTTEQWDVDEWMAQLLDTENLLPVF